MKTLRPSGLIALFVFVIAFEWLVIAADYKDSVFLGTYHLQQPGESANLVMRTDQTFQQEVTRAGATQMRHGRWRRVGEGEVAFSRDFLPLTGQELGADGTAYGSLNKRLGVLPSIALAQSHVLWYSNIDSSETLPVPGTYTADEQDGPSTLVLQKDHTFQQTVTHAGTTRHARGTWTSNGNGDILFSGEFLTLSGEALTANESAAALNPKGRYLQIQIAINPSFAQPVFNKQLLSY